LAQGSSCFASSLLSTMSVKFAGVGVITEWLGSSGEWIKKSLTPGKPGKPDETPEMLTKWLVFQFHVMILVQIANLVYQFLAAGSLNALIAAIAGFIFSVVPLLVAWVNAWIFWFSFAKREPSCCFFIEGFKFAHLIVGIFQILYGLSLAANGVNALLTMMSAGTGTAFIGFAIYTVVLILYALALLGVGVCLVKMGGKKAGVDIPDAPKVGAPAEDVPA